MNPNLIIAIVALIFVLMAGFKVFKKGSFRNFVLVGGIIVLIYSGLGLLGNYGIVQGLDSTGIFLSATGVSTGDGVVAIGDTPNYQPTGSYTTKDVFANTIVSGTAYYAIGEAPATTTATTNTNVGTAYTYWVSNGTSYWAKPLTMVAGSGVTQFVADAYQNGTATLTLYDTINRADVSNDPANNISIGANSIANVELTYLGTAKRSAMPFGGVLVVAYNSSISSLTCSGADLASVNPYHVTYTVPTTSHVYKVYAIASSLDDGEATAGKKITCQIETGSLNLANGDYARFEFIPANYYVSNSGEIILDTEKFADGETTRVGSTINNPITNVYWD